MVKRIIAFCMLPSFLYIINIINKETINLSYIRFNLTFIFHTAVLVQYHMDNVIFPEIHR